MKFLTSTAGLIGLGTLVVLFMAFAVVKKVHAANASNAPQLKSDESQQASSLTDFKAMQRHNEGELKEEGVAKTKLAEPTRHERVLPSELPPSVSAVYLPMRLRPSDSGGSEAASKTQSSRKAAATKAENAAPPAPTANSVASNSPEATSSSASEAGAKLPAEHFAPFGRLIKCELLLTIDSMSEETPIVGLVANDLWWNNRLIIPANSEVHGTAKIDRTRDRVISGTRWIVVLSADRARVEGFELTLDAVALDREDQEGSGKSWGLADGSYGLKGDLITTNDSRRIQAFAAAALSAAAGSLQTRTQGAFGESTSATPRNATLAGTQEVLKQLAAEIAAEIQRNGAYLRVPAGKQFYLYVREAILPDAARVAPSSFQTKTHEDSPSLPPVRSPRRLQ